MFAFATHRKPRRPSLTPMIDVVFLLLVFFMLAARFGHDSGQALGTAGGGAWSGPPRLVEVAPDGLRLNGVARERGPLIAALRELGGGAVVLRAKGGADVQALVDAIAWLRAAGFPDLALAE